MIVARQYTYTCMWFVDAHFSEYKKYNKYDHNEKADYSYVVIIFLLDVTQYIPWCVLNRLMDLKY